MRKKLVFLLVLLVCLSLGCSVKINPAFSDINVKQGDIDIPSVSGYFNFGNIPLHYYQIISFTIENNGESILKLTGSPVVKISGTNASDFIASSNQTLTKIDFEEFTTFTIRFLPISFGKKTAQVEIESNDNDESPYTFVIVGTCTAPAPEIHVQQDTTDLMNNVGTYEFGRINVGKESTEVIFTIRNNGNEILELTGAPNKKIDIIGRDYTMFEVNQRFTSSLIPSNNHTTFRLIFKPTTPGIKTAKISILNNDSDENPYTFTIYGTANASPEIEIKYAGMTIPNGTWKLDFGNTVVNYTSNDLLLTIYNIGTAALYFTDAPDSIKFSGTDPDQFTLKKPLASSSIPPGDSTTFIIVFAPTSPGSKYATVSIANTDEDEDPFTFKVQGNSVESEMNVKQDTDNIPCTTGTYDFGNVGINGNGLEVEFKIESLGVGDLFLTGSPIIDISGPNESMFVIDDNGINTQLNQGATTTFKITFKPTSFGTKSATISIANSDLDENPYTFSITGTGAEYTSGDAIGWIGGGSSGWKNTAGTSSGTSYQDFHAPSSVFVDSQGYIYVSDSANHRICKWDGNGNAMGWIGGGSNGWKTGAAPTWATDYQSFKNPQGVFVDSNGNIFVADSLNDRICKWNSNGNAIGWIGCGSNGWKQTPLPSHTSDYDHMSFDHPTDVTVDSNGNIFVADTENHRICKWDSNGNAIGWFGGGYNEWKTSDIRCSHNNYPAYFNEPSGVALDSNGNIYVSDRYNFRVCKRSSSGSVIGWIGGGSDGWKTSSGSNLGYDYKSFSHPNDVTISSDGYIYVADTGLHRICKWDLAGNAIGWIGGGSLGWKTTNASGYNYADDYLSFDQPKDAFVDQYGRIYIPDGINNRICKWQD